MKTLNAGFFKTFLTAGLFSFASWVYAGGAPGGVLLSNTAPILPPIQMSVIGEGMGNAVVGDGTLYNATSFNPALLGKAPGTLEFLRVGANVSSDTVNVINSVQNFNLDANNSVGDIVDGYIKGDSSEINSALRSIHSVTDPFLNKTIQAGVNYNFSFKVTENVGIEVYDNTHLAFQVLPGTILNSLINVPINNNSASGVSQAVGVFQTTIVDTVNSFITAAEQSQSVTIAQDIQNLKNAAGGGSNFTNAEQQLIRDARSILRIDISNLETQLEN